MNSMKVPEGYRLVTRASYGIPDIFHSIQAVRVADRKWWQFWRPKRINVYCTVEDEPTAKSPHPGAFGPHGRGCKCDPKKWGSPKGWVR